MRIVVTGSIAYDYLMSFPGRFTEHILPEHIEKVSLSFLVDSMDKRRGGCAPNIAYTLALLGERPLIMATAGEDFADYRRWLEAAGIDTSLVREVPGKFTASFFCSTDVENNQIASFYTGAMANAAELSFRTAGECGLTIVSPNDPEAMLHYADECRALGIPFIFDPGQQCARLNGDELLHGLRGARMLISNDYEHALIREKTRLSEDELLESVESMIVTRGAQGATIVTRHARADVPAVPADREGDPTGIGDAYRGGLMKGLARDLDLRTCAQIGSVAATYALEHVGGQGHSYTLPEFVARYEEHFGPVNL